MVLFVGALITRALKFAVCIGAPDFWKLPFASRRERALWEGVGGLRDTCASFPLTPPPTPELSVRHCFLVGRMFLIVAGLASACTDVSMSSLHSYGTLHRVAAFLALTLVNNAVPFLSPLTPPGTAILLGILSITSPAWKSELHVRLCKRYFTLDDGEYKERCIVIWLEKRTREQVWCAWGRQSGS